MKKNKSKKVKQSETFQRLFSDPKYPNYLKIAMQLAGFQITEFGVELMLRLMQAVEDRGGDLTMDEVTTIEFRLREEYRERREEQISL